MRFEIAPLQLFQELHVDLINNNGVNTSVPCSITNIKLVIKSDSAIGQHLIANPECTKTYTDDNFRIIGQARSSFH